MQGVFPVAVMFRFYLACVTTVSARALSNATGLQLGRCAWTPRRWIIINYHQVKLSAWCNTGMGISHPSVALCFWGFSSLCQQWIRPGTSVTGWCPETGLGERVVVHYVTFSRPALQCIHAQRTCWYVTVSEFLPILSVILPLEPDVVLTMLFVTYTVKTGSHFVALHRLPQMKMKNWAANCVFCEHLFLKLIH